MIKYFILFTLFLIPLVAIGATIFETAFNSDIYTLGPINGQDGWSVTGTSASSTIQNSTVYEGDQALQLEGASGYTESNKTGSATADGQIAVFLQRSADNTARSFYFFIESAYGSVYGGVKFLSGNIQFRTGASWNTITTYNTGQWYLIEIQWRSSDDHLRYRVDGGTWTDWYAYAVSGNTPDRVRIASDTNTTGDFFYADYIIESIEAEPDEATSTSIITDSDIYPFLFFAFMMSFIIGMMFVIKI